MTTLTATLTFAPNRDPALLGGWRSPSIDVAPSTVATDLPRLDLVRADSETVVLVIAADEELVDFVVARGQWTAADHAPFASMVHRFLLERSKFEPDIVDLVVAMRQLVAEAPDELARAKTGRG